MKKTKYLLFLVFILTINTLLSAPSVVNLNPFIGPSSGGTVVIITGTGFSGASAVLFDGVPAAGFSVLTDTTILATSPAHSPQVVSVTVTTPSGSSPNTPESLFVYQGIWQAYVANGNSSTVSVINTVNNSVITTLAVGNDPVAINVTPDGTKVYVVDGTNQSVSVIDTVSNTVIAAPIVGLFPDAVEVTPDGTKAFVVNYNNGTVSVINTANNTVSATLTVGTNPDAIAITPDGKKAFIANATSNNVSVIDIASNAVTTIPTGGLFPNAIAITPDGTKAYVVNSNSGTVSVINTSSNAVIATLTVGSNPTAIAITPDGTKAYVPNATSNTVSVINTATNAVGNILTGGVFPKTIIITPDGTKAYVVNNNSDNVSVIDTASNTVSAILTVGSNPYAIAITPDGAKVYVTNMSGSNVSVIDTASNAVSTIATGQVFPDAIVVTPDQAPLARFTFTLARAGQPSTFDASASVSPVGVIINYFWNFGDGTTLSTSQPIVQHTYATAGTFTVTLTVTNSAGTSTSQIFSHASSEDFNFPSLIITQSEVITHNGGPSATVSQDITILPPIPPVPPVPPAPLPPRHLEAHRFKNEFATQTDIINVLTWKAPHGGATPVEYRIFRNRALTKLAAVIPANEKLRFKDHNRKEERTYKYFVVTVDAVGNFSKPAVVVVNGRHSDSRHSEE